MVVQTMRHQFTVDEYYRMGQAEIFLEDDRVELIEGDVIHMTPMGSKHAGCLNRLSDRLSILQVEKKTIIGYQNPIRLNEYNEPEPDIVLLKSRKDFYDKEHPKPEDILLIIEIADSSLEYDRKKKIPLYARHGILETWLVDLVKNRIVIYREPSNNGYRKIEIVDDDRTFSPLAFPELVLSAKDILG